MRCLFKLMRISR